MHAARHGPKPHKGHGPGRSGKTDKGQPSHRSPSSSMLGDVSTHGSPGGDTEDGATEGEGDDWTSRGGGTPEAPSMRQSQSHSHMTGRDHPHQTTRQTHEPSLLNEPS